MSWRESALLRRLAGSGVMAVPMAGDPMPLVVVDAPPGWSWPHTKRVVRQAARRAGVHVQVEEHDGLPG